MTALRTLLARARGAVHTGIGTFGGDTFGSGSFGRLATAATIAARSRPLVVAARPYTAALLARSRPRTLAARPRSLVVVAVAP